MDRRNGGDPLAAVPPPRPPKSIPRVHRPRAPEPTMISSSQRQFTSSTGITTPTTSTHLINNNISNNNNNNNLRANSTTTVVPPLIILHNNNLSRNNSNLSSSSNSFTRRRPPPPSPILTPIPLNSTAPTIQTFLNGNLLIGGSTILQNNESPNSPVTLAAPRPESERLANEYVDTPFRGEIGQTTPATTILQHGGQGQLLQHPNHLHHTHIQSSTTSGATTAALPTGEASSISHSNIRSPKDSSNIISPSSPKLSQHRLLQPIIQPITKQPTVLATSNTATSTFVKDGAQSAPLFHDDMTGDSQNLITCPQCKRCRCEECLKPRQLPSTWVCNKSCLCSPESVIDYTSCLCCVKALFYHCSKDHEMECDDGESISCADNPCSCLPHRRTARWGWLSALSLVLPCLWCYWPMRGCIALCGKCYARYAKQGCRCQNIGSTSSMLPIVPLNTTGSSMLQSTKSVGSIDGNGNGRDVINSSGVNCTVTSSSSNSAGGGGGRSRKCDLTPEKRLLDTSPEY